MPAVVSLLRAVNVGGHAVIKMADLRALYESLKFKNVQTYVQSGNVVFQAEEKDLAKLARKIQTAIEKCFGVKPGIMLRTTEEMRGIVARNPFAKRLGIEPGKLLVYFLQEELNANTSAQLRALPLASEELVPSGKELFIYFSNGMGKSKLPWGKLEKICTAPGTGRNWNSVSKLLAMAEALDSKK